MSYNYVPSSFHTKKLCSRLSTSEVRIYIKSGHFALLSSLKATYDVHLRLIGKRVVHFLLVLIKPFTRCYGWGVTS